MRTSATAFWEELLEYIDERRVIPVVGMELLRTDSGDSADSFTVDLARRLAERLGIADPGLPPDDALNAVAMSYVAQGGRREKLYPALRSIMRNLRCTVPEPLRALARIPHFNLFVSTTIDGLLEQALNEERFGGASLADSLAFLPAGVPQDLPCPMRSLARPLVYHLMGRPSTSAYSCALTEEDTLEYFSALQTERRPKLLFDELRDNHLLLIGNRFPDWLARLFIRTTKGGRLSTRATAPRSSPTGWPAATRNWSCSCGTSATRRRFTKRGTPPSSSTNWRSAMSSDTRPGAATWPRRRPAKPAPGRPTCPKGRSSSATRARTWPPRKAFAMPCTPRERTSGSTSTV